jgi:hypothetical protein
MSQQLTFFMTMMVISTKNMSMGVVNMIIDFYQSLKYPNHTRGNKDIVSGLIGFPET